MGISGLWPALKAASAKRSLATIALEDGFLANPDGVRGLRIGIDASIWIVHATNWVVKSKDGRDKGENPELRTILFKCMKLMHNHFLPLFIFDGPYRPEVKRGKEVNRSPHWIVSGTQDILTALGIEWRTAPGEAEAELAYLNRIGIIDCVLTDDVDAFLFGAKTVMRNNTATLKFNTALGKDRDEATHTLIYTSERILSDCQLTRGGLLLVALLSGGDYDTGVRGAGIDVATGLARAGFGDSLLETAQSYYAGTLSPTAFDRWLRQWRDDIRDELRTNSKGCLKTLKRTLASKFPDTFPPLGVLEMYVRPVTSEFKPAGSSRSQHTSDFDAFPPSSQPLPSSTYSPPPSPSKLPSSSQPLPSSSQSQPLPSTLQPKFTSDAAAKAYFRAQLRFTFTAEPSIPGLAHICERFFEWGYRERLLHRFYTLVWPFIAFRALRRAALLADEGASRIVATHASTSGSVTQGLVKCHFTAAASTPRSYNHDTVKRQAPDDHTPLLHKISMARRHRSTDDTLEYRVLLDAGAFRALAEAGIEGTRHPPDTSGLSDWEESDGEEEEGNGGSKKEGAKDKDESKLRLWVPAAVLQLVAPGLVEEWKEKEEQKAERARNKGKRRAKSTLVDEEETRSEGEVAEVGGKAKTKGGTKAKAKARQKTKPKEKELFPMSSPPPVPTEEAEEDEQPILASQSSATTTDWDKGLSWSSSPAPAELPAVISLVQAKAKGRPGRVDDVFKARKAAQPNALGEKPPQRKGKANIRPSMDSDVNASDEDDRTPGVSKPALAAKKTKAQAKEHVGSSKVAAAAALFADVDVFRDLTDRPAPKMTTGVAEKGLPLIQPQPQLRTSSSKPRAGSEFIHRTDSAESRTSTSTAASSSTAASKVSTANTLVSEPQSRASSPSKRRLQPKPFPMSFDLDFRAQRVEDGDSDLEVDIDWEARFAASHVNIKTSVLEKGKGKERNKSSATKQTHPRPRTPDRQRVQAVHKSPRRTAGQTSPHRTERRQQANKSEPMRTLDHFWSSDRDADSDTDVEDRDGRASPTPRRAKPLLQPLHGKTSAAERKEREVDAIVISSDSDDERPPPARAREKRGMKRNSDPREVIEISD